MFLAFFGGVLDVCSVIVWLLAFVAFTVVLLAGGQIPVQQYVASVHVTQATAGAYIVFALNSKLSWRGILF